MGILFGTKFQLLIKLSGACPQLVGGSLTCTTYHFSAKHFSTGKCFLFIIVWALTSSCNHQKKVSIQQMQAAGSSHNIDQQGHRGCRGLMPENTIPAMLHALDLGVTTLEMDIVFTKDNVAILSHEPFFNHEITTRTDGSFISEEQEKQFNIYRMSFAETQDYDVGLKAHPRFPLQQKISAHKPALSDVFDSVKAYCTQHSKPLPRFNIETKTNPLTDNVYHPQPAAFVDMLVKLVKEKNMQQYVMMQSFDIRTLQHLHKNYPGIPAVLLIEDYDKRNFEQQVKALGFTPAVYSPHYSLVTPQLIELAHSKQVKVIPWTINDLQTIKQLIAMGADGIISDYPNLFNQ